MKKFLDKTGLEYLIEKMKLAFVPKSEAADPAGLGWTYVHVHNNRVPADPGYEIRIILYFIHEGTRAMVIIDEVTFFSDMLSINPSGLKIWFGSNAIYNTTANVTFNAVGEQISSQFTYTGGVTGNLNYQLYTRKMKTYE